MVGRKLRTGATLGLLVLALVLILTVALAATGCGAAQSPGDASAITTAPSTTSMASAPSSALSTSTESSTTTLAQADSLDTLSPADVVRTFFISKDATVRYKLMFQSTENLDPSMDGRGRAEPLDISNLVVTGPLAGEPLTDPTRPTWKERLLFGVSYHLDSASSLGEASGQKDLSVVVARQDSQSPWKILILNQGPPPKELSAAQQKKLDELSLADVVRTYFESFDFDTQVYLSAPQ